MIRIVLWGPPRCGKSWFLASLSRAVAALNTALGETADLRLRDAVTGLPVFSSAPPHLPTDAIVDHLWYLTWQTNPQRRRPQMQVDQFLISDCGGDALLSLGRLDQDALAYRLLREADAVIAFIDTCALQAADQAAIYGDHLPRLYDLLARGERRRPRTLALVVAKADRLSPEARQEPAEALLSRHHLPLPTETPRPGLTARAFLCSAAGFLDDEHRLPNMADDGLRAPGHWSPWRVHAPLLYILEEVERRRLEQEGTRVARLLFRRRRLADYERESLHALLRAQPEVN